jgi:hypothetical protein
VRQTSNVRRFQKTQKKFRVLRRYLTAGFRSADDVRIFFDIRGDDDADDVPRRTDVKLEPRERSWSRCYKFFNVFFVKKNSEKKLAL